MLRAYANGALFGERHGEGPLEVLWLHGWARESSDFAEAGSELSRAGHASVALDLPGFGASPAPEAPGGARYYATLLEVALEEVAERPLVLVGHSFGGKVALVLAARRPDLVRALVLTGAPVLRRGRAGGARTSYRLVRWLHRHGLISDARMERARQRHGSADYRAARGVMRDVLVASVNECYEDELAAWRGPTELLWGANDGDVPVEVARRAAGLLNRANLRVLDDTGHLVPTAAPHELVEVVLEVLQ